MAGETLSIQIYNELYRDITTQRLKCGEKLTLKMLKDRFGVSHTPIREALMRLSECGLVSYYSNCGVSVIEFTQDDITDLYRFAAELDSMAIRFCANIFNPMPLLLDLEEIVAKGNACLAANDKEGWVYYSERFHSIFYDHARNYYLDESAVRIRAKLEVLSTMYYNDATVPVITAAHETIYEKIKAGDFEEASRLMSDHLKFCMACALKAYKERAADRH